MGQSHPGVVWIAHGTVSGLPEALLCEANRPPQLSTHQAGCLIAAKAARSSLTSSLRLALEEA